MKSAKLGQDAYKHKLGLAKRLNELAANHSQLLVALVHRLEVEAAGGAKRPAADGFDQPAFKKQRMINEREQRRKQIWEECLRMVEKLLKNSNSASFRQPVDPQQLKIPDYLDHIKHPMDLGTVKKKIVTHQYTAPADMAQDVRLVWRNCYTYNGQMHVISRAAAKLSEIFERDWAKSDLEARWRVELMREQRENSFIAGDDASLPDDSLPQRMADLRTQLGEHIAAKDHAEGVVPGGVFPLEPHRDMTFEEKRKLSAYLSALSGDKAGSIVDIIRGSMEIPEGEAEIELDIDALNNATLWRLREFVDACMQGTATAPPKKSTGARPPDKRPPPFKSAPGKAEPAVAGVAPTLPAAPAPAPASVPAPAAPALAGEGAPATDAAPAGEPPTAEAAKEEGEMEATAPDVGTSGGGGAMLPPSKPAPHHVSAPGSPQGSTGSLDGDGIVGSTAQGMDGARAPPPVFGTDGTVAQSGTTKPQPSAFVKSKPKGEGVVVSEAAVNQEAWAAVGKAEANGDAAVAPGATAEVQPSAGGGGGDEVWEEFGRKADKSLQEIEEEQRKQQEEERQRKAAEEQRRQEEEDAKRKLEEEEREAERKRLEAVEAEKAKQQQELEGMAVKHSADADANAMMARELEPLEDAAMQALGMARRDDEDGDGGFEDM